MKSKLKITDRQKVVSAYAFLPTYFVNKIVINCKYTDNQAPPNAERLAVDLSLLVVTTYMYVCRGWESNIRTYRLLAERFNPPKEK